MRVATFLLALATAYAGVCDTSSCFVCMNTTGCTWYNGPAGFTDCRETTNSSLAATLQLTAATECPQCQAGSCTDCLTLNVMNATNNRTWYVNSVFGGTCGNVSGAPPPTPVGTYTAFDGTCPACKDSISCATCNTDPVCAWFELPGGADSKCREASPGFAYTKVTGGYCTNPNPCAGVGTCNDCFDVTVLENNTNTTPCSWYTPKGSMGVLYNPKCDLGEPGTVEGAFYDAPLTCPLCSATSCTSCKAEANCKWVAVVVATGSAFGQCLQSSTTNPTGKNTVDTCPDECEIFSCSGCKANPKCTWYSDSPAVDDTCDRSSDASSHPLTTLITGSSGTCPLCAASRCFECNSEAGCGWYVNTLFSVDVPNSGDCSPTSASPSGRKVENSDDKCDGARSGAANLAPGLLGLLVAGVLYHN